jgi:hypothetical protein
MQVQIVSAVTFGGRQSNRSWFSAASRDFSVLQSIYAEGAHAALKLVFGRWSGRRMNLTTHLCLALRLRMLGANVNSTICLHGMVLYCLPLLTSLSAWCFRQATFVTKFIWCLWIYTLWLSARGGHHRISEYSVGICVFIYLRSLSLPLFTTYAHGVEVVLRVAVMFLYVEDTVGQRSGVFNLLLRVKVC